jgi:hypothetical protein
MNPRNYKDAIFELVRTDDWTKVEERMVQDESFASLLFAYVETREAEAVCWSERMRITKTTHPDKKERALASKATHEAHLAMIETRLQLEVKVTEAFLGDSGMIADAQRCQELSEAWGRASLAGLI